jgi:hypothetical protein
MLISAVFIGTPVSIGLRSGERMANTVNPRKLGRKLPRRDTLLEAELDLLRSASLN